jgi:hypothetical protein
LPNQRIVAFLDPADIVIFARLPDFEGQLRVILDHNIIPKPPHWGGANGTDIDTQLNTQVQNELVQIIRQVKCAHNGQVFDVPANLTRDAADHWIAAQLTQTED